MGRQAAQRNSDRASGLSFDVARATDSDSCEGDRKPLLRGDSQKGAHRSSRIALWACSVCSAVFVAAYAWSLRGGAHSRDLRWINAHLAQIGVSLALTVAAHTAAQWATAFFSGPHRRLAWPVRGGLVGTSLLFLLADHGNDFQYHGLYNWLLFVVISVPVNAVLFALWIWYRAMEPRRFVASFLATGTAFALCVALALVHYQHEWTRGLLGRQMQVGCPLGGCEAPECTYLSNLPFVDLLPAGAQNFWTGSQRCKATQHFEATLSDDGLLTIRGCAHPDRMSYTAFPDTRRWRTEWKMYQRASYQTHVLNHLKTEKYTGPVRVDHEAVLARCGEEERLLVRVQRLQQRAPPEPPLAAAQAGAAQRGSSGKDAGSSSSSSSSKSSSKGGSGGGNSASGGSQERLNIHILFLDSVSRRHFFRRLPRTAAALEAINGRHQGGADLYQFFRYHTVGFSTDPNTHALYTGTTFPNPGATPVWEAFRQAGYVSGSAYNLCEDWGADYNSQATHHDHELVAPFCDPEYHPVTPDGEPYAIFQGAFSILRRCLRGRFVHRYNFDYARAFLRAYHSTNPYFFINSFHEGHEGTGEVLATIDDDTADFLLHLTPSQLNSSLIFVLADHGVTMGLNFLFAQNGRVEHKNPFLALLAPRWLAAAHPHLAAALRGNEQRLLSAFDLHTTLHHVLHLADPNPSAAAAAAAGGEALQGQYDHWARSGNLSAAVQWGVSLLAPIPAGRTCEQARVPADNCMCFAEP